MTLKVNCPTCGCLVDNDQLKAGGCSICLPDKKGENKWKK